MYTCYILVTVSLISFIFHTQVIFLFDKEFELYSMTLSLTLPLFTPPFSSNSRKWKTKPHDQPKPLLSKTIHVVGDMYCLCLCRSQKHQLHSHFIQWNKGASEGRNWALRTMKTPWNTQTAPSTAPKSYHWGWDYAGWWRGEGEEEEEAEGETAGRLPLHSLGKAQAAAHLYRLEESRREGSEPGE